MKEYTIRPLAANGARVLVNDLIIKAPTMTAAKMRAELMEPGYATYQVIDVEQTGWAGIQRQREKNGFGMSSR